MDAITSFVDSEIVPILSQHGGSVEVTGYNPSNKTLQIRLIGACANCPSSLMTTYGVIFAALQNKFPELVEDVEVV
jgi:Fe-S cluster biogenesis protein NfuA